MSLFRLIPALLAFTTLLRLPLVSPSGTPIPLSLYTDGSCQSASKLSPNVSVSLQTCAVTPGLGSVNIEPFPCQSGDVQVYAFSDTTCGTQSLDGEMGLSTCFENFRDTVFAAIMLSCSQKEPGQPAGTTTIAVAAIATLGAESTAMGIATAASATGTSAGASSPTQTPNTSSGSSGGTSSASPSPSSSATNAGSGWNSLTTGEKVGIIVALAVGIPPILISLYILWLKKKKEKRKRLEQQLQPEVESPHMHHGGFNSPGPSAPYYPYRPDPQPLTIQTVSDLSLRR